MMRFIVLTTFTALVLSFFLNCAPFAKYKNNPSKSATALFNCPTSPRTITCSANGALFAPTNPSFLSLVGNELQIALSYGADLNHIAELYRQARVKNVRIITNWREIETSQGVYNWGYPDFVLGVFAAKGINPVGIIGNTPRWASLNCSEDHPQCPVENLEHLRSFAQLAAQRYGPGGTNSVRDWEIRIEALPNRGLLTKEQYVSELNAAGEAIKAIDPGARIWGPEVAFISSSPDVAGNEGPYEWIDYTIANGQFDVFSIHHLADTTPAASFHNTKRVRERLDAAGYSATPLAITAAASKNLVGTQSQQAQNLQDIYACISAGGGDYAFWFAGTEWARRIEEVLNDVTYGILDYDLSLPSKVKPKEAYTTLSELGCMIR